ncbi:SIR2 family protein [Streptococcus equinus]|uniref:SIR2 family protein n=1 Tax=Streptococcus equinus TaxID=1335 RepID=UPI0012FB197A|nr:SIR2 family protein [Streptococcus equinus]QGX45250.1 hypothetical protein GO596_08035 [Streptococcus equinus]
MATKKAFLREYIKAIRDGNAALFAGAGLSRPSGFVDWKELLRPLAEGINLNIEDEHDLTLVAQYIQNESGNRSVISKLIMDTFNREVVLNDNVRILTRLPIETYWTTNYDRLIEDGLREANRNPDVKIEYKQLSNTKRDRDAIVYKMHGDVEHPADAVLTKDDYVKYDISYPFFRKVLQGDLISKTFLFIGFSFEDPNLDYVLSQTRLLLGENVRNHFCIMKTVKKDDYTEEEFGYKKAQQDLRKADLARQGIQIVYVDDFSEITDMLREIETAVNANNVFISGSADFYDSDWTKEKAEELAYKLSNQFVKQGYRVTSGFGLGIGSSVINGALDEINANKYNHIDEHLCLRPFPQNIVDPDERAQKWKKYREEMLSNNGIAVFMFGNKKDDNNHKIEANGCWEEYQIAKEKGCLIIPIGSTGDVAEKILQDIKLDNDLYSYLKDGAVILEKEKDVDKIIEAVLKIASKRRIVA